MKASFLRQGSCCQCNSIDREPKVRAEATPERKVAFIFSRFPSIWQSYLSREILGLYHKGLPLLILSLKNKKKIRVQSEALEIENRVKILRPPQFSILHLLIANGYFAIREAKKYFRTLYTIGRKTGIANIMTFLKNMIVFFYSAYFAWALRKENVKHIHASHGNSPALAAFVISDLTGIPFSFSGHANDIYSVDRLLKEKVGRAKFVIACTVEALNYLRKSCSKKDEKLGFVNYHGIRLDKFHFKEERPLMPVKLLSVGRVEESKGYLNLVKAAQILKQKGISFSVTIIGDGPLIKQLKSEIISRGVEREFNLLGSLPHDEVVKYYYSANVFVLPAKAKYHRGIPNVLLEAMASGLPVITTGLPAVKNELIVHCENGMIVEENDAAGIVDSIEVIFQDVELRKKIVRSARASVEEKFEFDVNIERLYSIFMKMTAEDRGLS